MNVTNAVLVVLTVVLAGVGPFIAVHRGGKAFDDEPEAADTHDTLELPRVNPTRRPRHR